MTCHPVSLVPQVVASTIEGSYGHHRTPWFESILDHIGASLAPRLPSAFTPLMLTSTVPGAREAIIANCVAPGVLVWVTGPTGAFAPLLAAWGANWRDIAEDSAGQVAPSRHEPTLALVEHVDGSGRLLPLQTIVRSIRERADNAVIVVDASVSFGADVAAFTTVDIDGIILVPEGALMGIPGLSIVAAGRRLLELVRWCRPRQRVRPYYFDLLKYEKAWAKRTTPYSPDISACVALSKALELIDASGGLEHHVAQHAVRATAVRQNLRGVGACVSDDTLTNAYTVCVLPDGVSARDVVYAAGERGVQVAPVHGDGSRLRIDHTGYLPAGTLEACCARIAAATRLGDDGDVRLSDRVIPEITSVDMIRPNIPPDRDLPVFEIPASEFVEQAVLHARRSGGNSSLEAYIRSAAEATFRAPHRHDSALLANRTIGFIGAGNIVRETVERCQRVGVRHILVYSPSLAAQLRTGERPNRAAGHKLLEYWVTRGVEVVGSSEEVFLRAHSIVLLPWFYDQAARAVFNKPLAYTNERLIDHAVLTAIERQGRADLIVNAAARGKLVDRAALLESVSAGWLRYYSDELPAPDDPLLAYRNVRFTGHVGGSCRQPQAVVGRNTHDILRRLVACLLDGAELETEDGDTYRVNVLNASLPRLTPWRSGAAHAGERVQQVRILITDRFDLDAVDIDGLRSEGWNIDVRDVSSEDPTAERLTHHLRAFRPHILMVRSRTRVDATVAAAACETSDLAAVIRPGVGIDNLYGGAQHLTEAGIRIINEPFGNSAAVAEMTMHFLVSAADNTLLAPGPTRVEPAVFAVMHEYRHPASPQIGSVITDVAGRLATWMGASAPAIILSGSGTGLMEAGLANLTEPGDHGLVISHGKFGERFVDIARALGRRVDVLAVPEPEWGRAISLSEVQSHLDKDAAESRGGGHPPISFLCLQQNETSSGIAYRADQLASIVRAVRSHNPGMAVIVDAISGAFAHHIDFDALDVDLLIVGSQKGLGVSSGLAFGQVSRRAWEKMLRLARYEGTPEQWLAESDRGRWIQSFAARQRVWYLSLLRLASQQQRLAFDAPPSAFHLLSTRRSLDMHDRDGGRDEVIARHARLAAAVRDGLAAAGLRAMADPAYHSDSVTPGLLPPEVTASTLRKQLEGLYGISIAGAQGDYWKRQMVRIGHLGFVYEGDIARCLRGVRTLLSDAARTADHEAATAAQSGSGALRAGHQEAPSDLRDA
jgi:aspartate aminotransferase-like enzyme/phosphoglycerate dehydrogenase-like enzyme